jgi:dihydrofolate synthase/folylpolyglutamate synthase
LQPQSSPTAVYQAALAYLHGRIDFERQPAAAAVSGALRLRRVQALLDRLGNPERSVPTIHVAGTKGKGSTVTLVASMLTAAGFRTGRYTSPHLEHLEERFAIDHRACSPTELVELVERVRPAAERLAQSAHGPPTFFELTTAMAFVHFARHRCDWMVLEVGLGGRLDSTNVCHPTVTAITTIGMDHQQILGNTLSLIAAEKAGIIKHGIPIVSGVTRGEAAAVIHRIATRRDAPLWQLGRDFQVRSLAPPPEPYGAAFDYLWNQRPFNQHTKPRSRLGLRLSMDGPHQVHNAGVALAIVDRLQQRGVSIPDSAIRQGLRTARAPARLQWVPGRPAVLLDTAHNPDSIDALVRVVCDRAAQRRCVVVFSASRDKDTRQMLESLSHIADRLILTRFQGNPRAASPDALAAQLSKSGMHECIELPQDALAAARRQAGPAGLVIITGSFFLAAELQPSL